MKLKLKESIRANGVQYLPPAVVDTDEIGITQADADVLVRRGTADVVAEESAAAAQVSAQADSPAQAAAAPSSAEDSAPAARRKR